MISKLIKGFLVSAVVSIAFSGMAGVKSKKVSTELSFEDLLVKGKYHFSDEAVVTVEQDKILDALLGIRKDFKDRMKRSAQRH